jgi:uncharacterized protein DUF6064
MSEWWTYSLSDFLMFSPRTYYRLFEIYNTAIWPGQFLALAAGIAIAALLMVAWPWRDRVILVLLGTCWLWVAWAFLFKRYTSINWASTYFAVAFALEALLLIGMAAFSRPSDEGRQAPNWLDRIGVALFLFALVIQPLIGPLLGRSWSQLETFGIAPDPTVIGTLGFLLLMRGRTRWASFTIPIIWCFITGTTLWTMHAADALIAPTAAILTLLGIAAKARLSDTEAVGLSRHGRHLPLK